MYAERPGVCRSDFSHKSLISTGLWLKNGNPLPKNAVAVMQNSDTIEKADLSPEESAYVRLYDEDGEFIAIYSKREKDYHIVKMFYTK